MNLSLPTIDVGANRDSVSEPISVTAVLFPDLLLFLLLFDVPDPDPDPPSYDSKSRLTAAYPVAIP
jgi:hypothetical protein